MSLRDDILPIAFSARAIAGELGFRQHTVAILTELWTGQHTGEGSRYPDSLELTESGGQPPKVRWLKDDELALANLGAGSVEIGPITPAFAGGGTDLEALNGDLSRGATRHLVITGPKHPTGARYRITRVDAARALRYMIRAEPARPGE